MDTIYLQALEVWLVLLLAAIINATIRTRFIQPKIKNELRSHQISSITAIIFFLFIIYLFFRFTTAEYTENQLVNIGFMWMILTIIFEFLFGRFVMKNSFSRLLEDYNLTRGRLWIWVLISLLIGPVLVTTYFL
ncbi:MAG: hypothetical protein KKF16_10960 [Euryarchaeota archaeon]|nr:hypothetical protein [Euryarchaeota archaeon]MBV1754320.1 hypothetical protein [Methanobacterium sp.]